MIISTLATLQYVNVAGVHQGVMDLGGNLPESLSQYLMLGHSAENDDGEDGEEDADENKDENESVTSISKDENGDFDNKDEEVNNNEDNKTTKS